MVWTFTAFLHKRLAEFWVHFRKLFMANNNPDTSTLKLSDLKPGLKSRSSSSEVPDGAKKLKSHFKIYFLGLFIAFETKI